MRYDPDIALAILKAVEDYPEDEIPAKTALLPELDEGTYHFHCRLLAEAEYISVYAIASASRYRPRQLKWPGVQFLELFRNKPLLQRTIDIAHEKGVGMALETLFRIGTQLGEELMKS